MKLITRSTDYAIRALAYLGSHKGEKISAVELVRELKIPRPFLRRIMQESAKAGFVRSYRGIGGGFELAKRPSSIYVMDVIAAFQGPFSLNECYLKRKLCPNTGTCILKKKIDVIARHVANEINAITLTDLMKGA
jgi:Rrf2 family protein